MEKIIIAILGFIAIGAAYFIGTVKNKGFKNPFESEKKYIDRRIKKYEKELDKKSDSDIINMLDNTTDVLSTITKGRDRLKDLFHKRGVGRPGSGHKNTTD